MFSRDISNNLSTIMPTISTNNAFYSNQIEKMVSNLKLKTVSNNSKTIIEYIKTNSAISGTCLDEINVFIPSKIKSLPDMKKWIFVYLKMVKRYKVCHIDGKHVFHNKGFTSLYEEIGHVYNHRDVYDYYCNLPLCKKTHEYFKNIKKEVFYSNHLLSSELFSEITYEISKTL